MAKTEALAQLKEIHLPSPVGWWPLAPGWYVIVLFILLATVWLVFSIHKRKVHALAKNQALNILRTYQQQYENDRNTALTSARISELLKRVALAYYPRQKVASMHGEDWIEFLNNTSKGIDFKPVKAMLLDSPFKSMETIDLKPLIIRAELWIKQRGVPCLN